MKNIISINPLSFFIYLINMTDFSSQIDLITSKLSEQLNTLELEYQRWSDYKTDYDALENQLRTLPENTTKSAMVRLNSRSIF